ncbi:MAG: hypothetical protein HOG97_00635, partial [Candidatus Marinimicrobia bacterium]|nr:hypothetical protein [Candidatus Neomarinimicrobiota bacterium]
MNKLRVFPKLVIVIGIIFALSGVVAFVGGVFINTFISEQLANQNITTPDDASIPGVQVNGIATAL